MCGIAALIRFPHGHLTLQMIRGMTDMIKHRGPDDEGFLCVESNLHTATPLGGACTPQNVYTSPLPFTPKVSLESKNTQLQSSDIAILLGHRRLSIVDLSAHGHQPMCLADSSTWITYNGEIYNYLEIRQELEIFGHIFHSQSDTEVILKAYQHWGHACLHKFNGMFAFLIIDLKHQRFFAARDRFGVKPLYIWKSPTAFLAFASEIKQFTALPGWQPTVNSSRAIDYLTYGLTDFSDQTLFSGVFQLRGGEFMESPLNISETPQIKRWYQLRKNSSQITFEEAKHQFQELFKDAVRLRLRADVDIGSCLSGGLDSSSIVCMAHSLLQKGQGKQKTFSACSHVPKFDESQFMHEIIRHTNVEGHFVTPFLENLLQSMKTLVWQQDEPFGSSSIFAQYKVFELAKKKSLKVMLDGQGADESLSGYSEYWMAHLAQLLKSRHWSAFQNEYKKALETNSLYKFSISAIMKQLLPAHIKHSLKSTFFKYPSAGYFFPWLNFQHPYKPASLQSEINLPHLIDQLSYAQLLSTNLPSLLRYEDRNSMAHSIEARTPFLDYRLVEFCFSLPSEFKISKGYTKRILRESMSMLPEKVRWRTDKLGFATAEENWMCDEQPELFRKEVSEAVLKSNGLINTKALKLADNVLSRRVPFDWTLWRIINYGYWVEAFSVR